MQKGKHDRLSDIAAELVRVQGGRDCYRYETRYSVLSRTRQATIPIVFAAVADPVRAGLFQVSARPGGNITGLTSFLIPSCLVSGWNFLKRPFPKLSTCGRTSGCYSSKFQVGKRL